MDHSNPVYDIAAAGSLSDTAGNRQPQLSPQPAPRRPAPTALRRRLARICAGLRSAMQALASERHAPIDDAALRDLGMTRSELDPRRALTDGLVEATRVRAMLWREGGA